VYNIITPVKRDGAVLGIMGLNVDISERKELQQQLLQAQKLESIGTLAGGIAHDFNNILSIIMGHASLLTEVAGNPAKLSRSAAAIQKAAKRGAALVRQILTFARKADATFEPVNINEIATELGKMLEETFPRTMNIVLDLAADLPSIDADRTQMHQTLLNLCVNARDAMPQGGVLTISSRLAFPHEIAGKAYPSFICVTVADDGSGMDEATQRRIFEPFFTTKESGKGTGLGLAVVYGIMESHHGFITVDSVSGRGTAFHLFFPVPATHIVEQQAAVTMEGKTQGGTETLLVVEDEEMLCELLRNILEAAGYTVLSASDGEQAVSMYESLADDIALVITDIGLPRMSGHEVFRRLRAMRPQARVIIATGYIEPDAKSNLLALGAKHILQKPYLPEEVLRSVRDALTSKG
jgi:nitrogen-specific signal transduction histidine kinase/CheY-like chemotaxis protein